MRRLKHTQVKHTQVRRCTTGAALALLALGGCASTNKRSDASTSPTSDRTATTASENAASAPATLATPLPGGSQGTGSAASEQRSELLFSSPERYQVSGRITAVDDARGEITIQRQNLPPALLRIEESTKVQVDGRPGAFSDLKPGCDVRASFNLSGRRPIALEVNASASNR